MTQKLPWWQVTSKRRVAVWIGSFWLIAGLGDLALGIIAGRAWNVVLGAIFLLCGLPWCITAVALLRRNRIRAASGETQPPTI